MSSKNCWYTCFLSLCICFLLNIENSFRDRMFFISFFFDASSFDWSLRRVGSVTLSCIISVKYSVVYYTNIFLMSIRSLTMSSSLRTRLYDFFAWFMAE